MEDILSLGFIWQVALTAGFVAVFTLWGVWAERKVSAFIQDRLGPMETGPWGVLQTLADVIKLVLKEPIVPAQADRVLFVLAPGVIFVAVFAGFAVLPPGPGMSGSHISIGVLYILGIVAIDVIGLLMAGWGAGNKYALLGAVRAVAQIVSYEAPVALAMLAGVLMYGTLDLQEITLLQGIYSPEPVRLLGYWDITQTGGILSWGIIRYPHLLLVFVLYFVATLAETNRAPFDIPEAESELVSGFHVEYSGLRFALIFLAEYGKMLLVCVVGATLFWGGWNTPLPNLSLPGGFQLPLAAWTSGPAGTLSGSLWGFGWLLIKSLALVWVQMWVRWTYPRLRADQLMTFCWKYLTPAGLVLFLISTCWKLAETYAWL
ncbi:MAG: complex I subunit 1 family protein [Bacteroidia bacterium]|nr:complex I subunit 1 family protein [Bacteroidia bacterium]